MLGKVDAKSVIIMLERRDPVLENFCIACRIAAIVSKLHILEQIRNVVKSVMIGESINMPLINSLNQENGERMRLYKQISALSPKETQVFEHVKEGHLNKQIAHELKISEATIKYHVGNILCKLDCQNRTRVAVIVNKPALFL